MPTIADNLQHVYQQIHAAAKLACRNPEGIHLLAVSKAHPASAIRECYKAGQRHFGENYLQEALLKQEVLADLTDLCWHFIGPLQTNKTRKVAEQFDWVHSIDRQRIAERLSEQRPANCEPLNVCIQVNLQDEDSKSGVALQDVAPLAKSIMALPNLKLRGLMAIPVKSDDYAVQLDSFTQVAKLMRELQSSTRLATLDTLSMGMSNDLQAAIAAGATIVRVGTGIFGPRQPQT